MEQATGLVRTLEAIMPLAQHDPSILDNIDADKALRGLAEINGVDMDMMRPVEEVLERRRQQQEAMQMQQAAAMAPGLKAGAEAAATLSQMEGAA
ncbi:MAG: portal protein [Geminicoccaceae bacterium]